MSGFQKAVRTQVKLRVALIGPSGSGKTYSALRLAKGIGGRVAFIDTEGDRGTYYADEFDYDRLQLDPPYAPERYITAIRNAESAGYDVLIMDSASHEWIGKGGILEIHGNMTGNSYTNWNAVTPRHDAWVDAQVRCRCHLIITMRGKDEYVVAENEKGKQAPKKIGVGPVQRGGLEYEYTVAFLIDQGKHIASSTKDNTHLFEQFFDVLTEEHGAKLKAWAESGAPAASESAKTETHAGANGQSSELGAYEALKKRLTETFALDKFTKRKALGKLDEARGNDARIAILAAHLDAAEKQWKKETDAIPDPVATKPHGRFDTGTHTDDPHNGDEFVDDIPGEEPAEPDAELFTKNGGE